ncbi:hypothetical protein BKA80DRAFT_117543 [Phyllosticta citrichinensis]
MRPVRARPPARARCQWSKCNDNRALSYRYMDRLPRQRHQPTTAASQPFSRLSIVLVVMLIEATRRPNVDQEESRCKRCKMRLNREKTRQERTKTPKKDRPVKHRKPPLPVQSAKQTPSIAPLPIPKPHARICHFSLMKRREKRKKRKKRLRNSFADASGMYACLSIARSLACMPAQARR